VTGIYLVALSLGLRDPLLVHVLTVVLIALAVYGMVVLPFATGVAVSLVISLTTVGAWMMSRSTVLGWDVLAMVGLCVFAGSQQRLRMSRLQRLKQQTDDLDEELSLKGQALDLAQQNHEALTRKLSKYQQLHTIAEQLSRLSHLDGITQLAVARAFELIGKSDVCLLYLVEKAQQELALYASKKAPGVAVIRAKQGDQFDQYVLRTQRPLLVNDVRRDFRFTSTGAADRPIGSVIACPILMGESTEGLLRLDSAKSGAYTQDDLRFLDILLDLVDTAIANARLFAQTQQLAITDGLTALYRRQPFLEQLAREIARATRSRESLTVLMVDIDDFKRYNDTFGHTAGDLVLKTVAEIARETIPRDGMCARYGGEEFAILLPHASREQSRDIADQLRRDVESRVRTMGNGSGRAVTVSLGIAVFPDDAQSDLELLRRADQRLYHAKRMGKNRVCSS